MSASSLTCDCGRTFVKQFGLTVHLRTCPIGQERSAVYIAAIEAGQDAHKAVADWRANRAASA